MDQFIQNTLTFNTYDIFANLIPGTFLLFGLWVPFIETSDPIPELGGGELIVLGTLAFLLGIAIQGIGSYTSSRAIFSKATLQTLVSDRAFPAKTKPFDEKLRAASNAYDKSTDRNDHELYGRFYCACVDTFGVDKTNPDGSRLFKAVLSYLESSPMNRGLRLQSLHLLARGSYISTAVIGLYYAVWSVSLFCEWGVFPTVRQWGVTFPVTLTIVLTLTAVVFRWRAIHFEEDIAEYIMAEFVLATNDSGS